MKKTTISVLTALACSMGMVVSAQAQQPTQQFNFPPSDGSHSPASTLRITEQSQAAPVPAPVIRDTPESIKKYTLCRDNADRASVDRMQMQTMVGTCLKELAQRREQQ